MQGAKLQPEIFATGEFKGKSDLDNNFEEKTELAHSCASSDFYRLMSDAILERSHIHARFATRDSPNVATFARIKSPMSSLSRSPVGWMIAVNSLHSLVTSRSVITYTYLSFTHTTIVFSLSFSHSDCSRADCMTIVSSKQISCINASQSDPQICLRPRERACFTGGP